MPVFVEVGVDVFGGLPAGGSVAVAEAVVLGVEVSVNVGWDVLVDIADCVGVDCCVLVGVNVAVGFVVGVTEGELFSGADFFGALVGFGVGGDGYVGQVTGLVVGICVGEGVGNVVFAAEGEVCGGSLGMGVLAGSPMSGTIGAGGSEPVGASKRGVTDGTGVSRL